MKSETSFRVFFLKQHRKNSLKNIFSHQKVYFWISAFDHRAIVVPKMHIVHWGVTRVQAQAITLVPSTHPATNINSQFSSSMHQSRDLKYTQVLVVKPPSLLTPMSPALLPLFTLSPAGWQPQHQGLRVNTSTWRSTPSTAWARRRLVMVVYTTAPAYTALAQVRLQAGTAPLRVKLASLQSMQATLVEWGLGLGLPMWVLVVIKVLSTGCTRSPSACSTIGNSRCSSTCNSNSSSSNFFKSSSCFNL